MQKLDFIKTDENRLAYTVFLPENYSKEAALPMILFLHGAGERGNGTTELEKATDAALSKHLKNGTLSVNAIVLCPQCPSNMVWNQFVYLIKELCDKVASEYGVDTNRISVTGLSMGGFGTWEIGMTFPGAFAALAPICGGGMAWRTPALKGKPIWAFHGNKDNVVNISNSIDMVTEARKNGANVKFTIFDGVDHNSWDPAYLDTKVLDWLISKSL